MKHWTEKEDKHLLQWYGQVPNNVLIRHLPGRTTEAVRARVKRLRKKGFKFNNNELARSKETE